MALAVPEHDARHVWSFVLERARTELPETTVVMWFADVAPLSLSDESLQLAVPSQLGRALHHHHHLSIIVVAAA